MFLPRQACLNILLIILYIRVIYPSASLVALVVGDASPHPPGSVLVCAWQLLWLWCRNFVSVTKIYLFKRVHNFIIYIILQLVQGKIGKLLLLLHQEEVQKFPLLVVVLGLIVQHTTPLMVDLNLLLLVGELLGVLLHSQQEVVYYMEEKQEIQDT